MRCKQGSFVIDTACHKAHREETSRTFLYTHAKLIKKRNHVQDKIRETPHLLINLHAVLNRNAQSMPPPHLRQQKAQEEEGSGTADAGGDEKGQDIDGIACGI